MKNCLTPPFLWQSLMLLVVTSQSCQQDVLQSPETSTQTLNTTGSCQKELIVIGTLNQVPGEVVSETNIKPAIYGIKTASVQSINGYTAQIFVPCNLPDSLKQVGKRVSVSGRVLSYGKDNEIRMDMYGQPFEITALTVAKL